MLIFLSLLLFGLLSLLLLLVSSLSLIIFISIIVAVAFCIYHNNYCSYFHHIMIVINYVLYLCYCCFHNYCDSYFEIIIIITTWMGFSTPPTPSLLIGGYWCQAAEPMKRLLNQLGTWPLTSPGLFQETLDLESVLVNLSLVNVGPLLEIGVYIDLKNSSLFIPTVRF